MTTHRLQPSLRGDYIEQPVVIDCSGSRMIGIETRPALPADVGVVIVVGGPQYRSGSHRQFTLLARQLAENGIASIRFDYRGMGDSEGEPRDFEHVQADIRAAVDQLQAALPALKRIVLWGLCDAATASACYSTQDPRIGGLVLLNPWVHSDAAEASARLRFYYIDRLLSGDFWRKLLTLEVGFARSGAEILKFLRKRTSQPAYTAHFTQRMLDSLKVFSGDVLIVLSGQDMTAQKYLALTQNHPGWRAIRQRPNLQTRTLAEANHTFSSATWRDQVASWTLDWLRHASERNEHV